MASAPMKRLLPRVYWAGKGFVDPGVYVWAFGKNLRVMPWPKALL